MLKVQDLDRSWLAETPALKGLFLTDGFRLSRPVRGRPYVIYAGILAAKYADIEGAVVFTDTEAMSLEHEATSEPGEVQLITSTGIAERDVLRRVYGRTKLKNAFTGVVDNAAPSQRRIPNASLGEPHIIDGYQIQPGTQPGSLIASAFEDDTLRGLQAEQGRVARAAGVRTGDLDLFRGPLMVPWMYFPDSTPKDTVNEAHQFIAGSELPQVVLDSIAYIALGGGGVAS